MEKDETNQKKHWKSFNSSETLGEFWNFILILKVRKGETSVDKNMG